MRASVKPCKKCGAIFRHDGRECPECAWARTKAYVNKISAPAAINPREILTVGQAGEWFNRHPKVLDEIEAKGSRFLARLRRYNLTVAAWGQMVADCNGMCTICRREPDSVLELVIDHDHIYGIVRGLLCGTCNTGLGMLGIDGPDGNLRTRAVLGYLTRSTKQLILAGIRR